MGKIAEIHAKHGMFFTVVYQWELIPYAMRQVLGQRRSYLARASHALDSITRACMCTATVAFACTRFFLLAHHTLGNGEINYYLGSFLVF
jgi:hypothetical protein